MLQPLNNGPLAATRRELLVRFRAMYQAKHFELYLFDLEDGYLQTTLSDEDRMPLRLALKRAAGSRRPVRAPSKGS